MLLLSQELVAENEMEQDVFVCCSFLFPNASLSPFLLLCAALISGFLTLYFSVHYSYFLSSLSLLCFCRLLNSLCYWTHWFEQIIWAGGPCKTTTHSLHLIYLEKSTSKQNTTEQQCLFFLFQSSYVHFGSPGIELFTKKTLQNF